MADPDSGRHACIVSFSASPELTERIDDAAAGEGRTRASLCRHIVTRFLEEQHDEQEAA
jgi:predicted DNA-binding protein